MPSIDPTNYPVLSSDWTGLSKHLIASFYPVRRIVDGTKFWWEREPNSTEVQAPLTDGTIEQTANWTSPFENQQADAKLSSVSALLQMNGLQPILNSIAGMFGNGSVVGDKISSTGKALASLAGKTAVTKLNSTQIFSGMPPMKISVTAHFRALRNSDDEVQLPIDQLMAWTLPKKLSSQGFVGNAVDAEQELGWKTLYPSEAPQIIGMSYANCLFMPLVIEAMPVPLTGPRDRNGRMISAQIALTLGSLSALDASDWTATRRF
ncbi:MAG: hypothetical protein HHJ17_08645 [Rhodoferax sp.]|uniref:hypothetical protein n=1 Tax=Rhodoferax sp. TaxID=50421 RepID=UPI0017C45976|nr:hypothetical protein [Rhodoferax sp.]NMM13589.1 hypothetical protein [Rhodoferax sp.]